MTGKKTFRRPALALTILAFVAGCSALKVDVDVYKGPLANEERVQMEQMAVMAIGAKPLLIELRDRLEWQENIEKERKQAIKDGWYRRDFIPPGPSGISRLARIRAARVNDILSLYDDCGPRDLNEIILRTRLAFTDYERAICVFRPPDATEAKKSWKRIEAQVYASLKKHSGTLEPDHPALEGVSSIDTEILTKGIGDLFEAYKLLLTTNKFDSRNPADVRIFKAHKDIMASLDAAGIMLIKEYPLEKMIDEDDPTLEGGNSHFMALQNRGVVEAHAELLFPETEFEEQERVIGEAKTAFIEKTVEVAGAFMDAREALARLWHDTLCLVELLNDPEHKDCRMRSQCNRPAVDLIVELTEPERLACAVAFCGKALKGKDAGLCDTLKREIPKDTIAKWTSDGSSLAKLDPREKVLVKDALTSAFAKDPAGTATGLMMLNKFFASAGAADFLNSPYKSADRRVFGLVHGPTVFDEPDAEKGVSLLAAIFGPVCSGIAGGLEAGRLNNGLETLIENYLIAADSNGRSGTATEWERLVGALVQFAEKVLFIANNQDLLSQDKNDNIGRYTTVLQAVGNSILVQADELRCKSAHTNALVDRSRSEVKAFRKAFGETPVEVIEKKDPDARKVLDELIQTLQYQYIHEIGKPHRNDAAARDIAQAIEAAYAYRCGMVYIRPPSAYLRSSYPATSLQSDPQKAWRNMLDDQAIRGLPVIGECWANRRETGLSNDERKVVAEIDKQFWQNINSVRVAGAGITNYVIVKDDIGNWYVKRYAADSSPIYKSAMSLAMYNIGERMAADLLNIPAEVEDAAKAAENAPHGGTALQRLFRKYKTTYNEKTCAHYDELAKVMSADGGLKSDISNTWEQIGSTDTLLTDALKTAYDSVLAGAAMKPSGEVPEADRGGKIIDALNAIRRFHSVLQAKIAELPKGDGEGQLKKESKSAAQESAANIVGNTLDTMVQRRQAAIKEYETAIMFIGEAAKPPQAGSAAKKPEAATDNSGT